MATTDSVVELLRSAAQWGNEMQEDSPSVGTISNTVGAPPPLVGMLNVDPGLSTPQPTHLGAPPQLLPPVLDVPQKSSCPPELLPLEETGVHQPIPTDKLRTIQKQKEELRKQLEQLQAQEDQLGHRTGGGMPDLGAAMELMPGLLPAGGGSPFAGTMSQGMPPPMGVGMNPGGANLVSLVQANRMAGMGWNFAQGGSSPQHVQGGGGGVGALSPFSQQHLPKIDNASMCKVLAASQRLVDFSREPLAMTWLQKVCEEGPSAELDTVFEALLAEQTEVFTDPTISSIIPVIYPKLRPAQALQLIEKIAACFGAIAYNMHGTRVAQKVIEQMKNAPSEQVTVLAQALALQVPQLVKDLNGNHVIQECLQRFPPGDCQFIHEVLSANVVEFGTHRHGCCVLQRCIEHGNHDQKMCLVSEIINNGLFLVQDPFGNYLLQYILEMDIDVINVKVIRQFLGHIAGLSTNKFASNVIEKCLKIAPEEVRGQIVDEICDRTKLPVLLQDQYANYVVQTSLHTCNQSQFYALQAMIRPLMQLIKNTPHGKRIESKLRTRTFEQNNPGLMSTPPRRSGYTGTGRMSDALGVTPDGQWLRGGNSGTPSHLEQVSTTPTSMTPPSMSFLPASNMQSPAVQLSLGDVVGQSPSDSALEASLGDLAAGVATPPRANAGEPSNSRASTPASMGGMGGFKLNANARPFMSPPQGTPKEEKKEDAERWFPMQAESLGSTAKEEKKADDPERWFPMQAESLAQEHRELHPAALFAAMDDDLNDRENFSDSNFRS